MRLETLHAVTYFAPESRAAADTCGLRGFWMGYFGFRAAPLGAVGPEMVTATFANFAPAMVERAIPDSVGACRARRAARRPAARRRGSVAPDRAGDRADRLRLVAAVTDAILTVPPAPELPLFSANRVLAPPADGVEALWQASTTLREHRGDAHVVALRAAELAGCEAHVLYAAEQGVPESLLRDNRGWSASEWDAARAALAGRGLVAASGEVTPEGRAAPGRRGGGHRHPRLRGARRARRRRAGGRPRSPRGAVVASGLVPYPNPMGLPPVGAARST